MCRSILSCSVVSVALSVCLTQSSFAADNGDGTYTNPPLYADFPDPDIIRVGDDFYMVSTTFVNSPGLAVLHSKDLVNWTTINNVIDRLQGHPGYDMNGGPLYRNGVFAPSIRYHNGTYYVAVQPNGTGQGLQIYHTQDPAGDWQLNQLNGGAFDPGLFFEDNGTPYVIYGGAWQNNIYVRQLTPNLNGFATARASDPQCWFRTRRRPCRETGQLLLPLQFAAWPACDVRFPLDEPVQRLANAAIGQRRLGQRSPGRGRPVGKWRMVRFRHARQPDPSDGLRTSVRLPG